MEKRDIDIILNHPANWEKLKGCTVLVTGATGRLGIYIVNTLLALNQRSDLGIHILALARSREKIQREFPQVPPELQILEQDITEVIPYTGRVDYIFHTAGLASPFDFTHRPTETLWGHVKGTKNVLELARKCETKRILYVSTVEVYGTWHESRRIQETDMGPMWHTNARACYPEAKRLCETMLACFKAEYGVDYTVVRLCHTFGPGISLEDGRAFAEFIRCAVHGEDIVLQTDGSAVRTYTYVSDAVGAMFLALLNGAEEYYNVAAIGNRISIRDLAEMVAAMDPTGRTRVRYAASKGSTLRYLPFELGIMDSGKIESLGWKPQVDLKHAFQWTVESFINREEATS